jgi:beta-N-acetylhexosaminidase
MGPAAANRPEKATFIRRLTERMTTKQKIGQCVVVGMSGTQITNDLREAITRHECGGVRLSPFMRIFRYFSDERAKAQTVGRDYVPSLEKVAHQGLPPYRTPEQYAALLNELRGLAVARTPAIPLHMVIDQEGDTSRDIARGGFVQFPSSMGLAASGDPELVYQVARAVGRQMKASGLDMIHSPVVDVNINPANPEIGRRSFSDDPKVVAYLSEAMVRGFKDEGVIAAAKHFPGRGDSAVDAHHACPSLDVGMDRMRRVELFPYKYLIEHGLDAVMVAHCLYPQIDDEISTVSRRIVTDILRGELGFTGLITTDSMTMGALIDQYGVGEACARALAAGADTVLMKAENQWRGEMFYTIEKWVEEGRISIEELDAKVERILGMKYDYGLFDTMGMIDAEQAAEPYSDPVILSTAREAARAASIIVKDELGAIPLDLEKRVLLINQQNAVKTANDEWDHPALFQELLERELPGLQTIETQFGASEIDEKTIDRILSGEEYDLIIATNFYDRQFEPQRYASRLIQRGLPVLLVTNTPYRTKEVGGMLEEAPSILLSMNLTPPGLRMMRDVILGREVPSGRWPLSNYNPFDLPVVDYAAGCEE